MFEYAKNELQKKLNNLENKYEKTALESKKLEERKIKLENYMSLMNNFIDSNILLVISFVAFCISLLAAVDAGMAVLFAVISFVEGGIIVENRKAINKNYSEFLHEKKLFNLKNQLDDQEKIINEKKEQLLSKIDECNNELTIINKLEDEPVDLVTVSDNPYYLANTKEEYYIFNNARENGLNNLLCIYWDNFLNEKVNPTMVHYNSKIVKSIECDSKSKKLVKKL